MPWSSLCHSEHLLHGLHDIDVARPCRGQHDRVPRHAPPRRPVRTVRDEHRPLHHVEPLTFPARHLEAAGLARPRSHLRGSHVVKCVGSRGDASGVSVERVACAGVRQAVRREIFVVVHLRANYGTGFLDVVVRVHGPNFVNGSVNVPSPGVALGNDHHVAGSEEVLGPVRVAQHAVSLQHVEHLGHPLSVGGRPAPLAAVPRSGAEHAVVGELAGPVLRRAPVVRGPRSLGGQVFEREVFEGHVAEPGRGFRGRGGRRRLVGWRVRVIGLLARQRIQIRSERARRPGRRQGSV
mmetsp:Transcript_16380/g.35624  ORF Transcript_16380/g.35624 Transcript_16380/m.35624 type:complete len:294 (-) Transcript_16380:138-1019(-)